MKIYYKIRNKIKKYYDMIKNMKELKSANLIVVDTPTHGNLGDQAIAIAEFNLLKRINKKYVEITASQIDGIEKQYAKVIPSSTTICIHGGGFLGNLWEYEEYRLRKIIKAFCKNKVIIFPQTITFDLETEEGKKYFEESKDVYSKHNNLTIFAREKNSYDFMKKNMPEVHIELAPDVVMMLDEDIDKVERKDILFCMRADREKSISEEEMDYIKKIMHRKFPKIKFDFTDTVLNEGIQPEERYRKVKEKLEQFSHYKLVITDRLHGMVFAAITGTPCIALNNCNKKVENVYQWIKDSDYVYCVSDMIKIEKILDQIDMKKDNKFDFEDIRKKATTLYHELI